MTISPSEGMAILNALGVQKIKQVGDKLQCDCPFAFWKHKGGVDKHPSFVLTVGGSHGGGYVCSACGERGTIRNLVFSYCQMSGNDYRDFKKLVELKNPFEFMKDLKRPDYRIHREEKVVLDWSEYELLTKAIPRYALDRGITKAQAKKWRLGHDLRRDRLFIPIFSEEGEMVGWSGRAVKPGQDPKYLNSKGMQAERYLFGEHMVNIDYPTVALVESFMDVFRLDRAAIPNPVSNLGTAFRFDRFEKLLAWGKPVIIFPHNDAAGLDGTIAGDVMANAYRNQLRKAGIPVYVAAKLEGKKDVDEWSDEEIQTEYQKALETFGG